MLQVSSRDDFTDDALVEEIGTFPGEWLVLWGTIGGQQESPEPQVLQPSRSYKFEFGGWRYTALLVF